MNGTIHIDIGTSVYVPNRTIVMIDCNIVNGTPPISISWFQNEIADLERGNASTISITAGHDAYDDDVFSCKAINIVGFDIENSTIKIFGKQIHNYFQYL